MCVCSKLSDPIFHKRGKSWGCGDFSEALKWFSMWSGLSIVFLKRNFLSSLVWHSLFPSCDIPSFLPVTFPPSFQVYYSFLSDSNLPEGRGCLPQALIFTKHLDFNNYCFIEIFALLERPEAACGVLTFQPGCGILELSAVHSWMGRRQIK